MKKRALKKDFYMEIRKTLNRFLSILLINALGVAFFAGVRAAEPDMKLSADAYYDESNLMDIQIMGSLGMTEEDLAAISEIDGVKEAMAFYSVDMFCQMQSEQLNMQVMSIPDPVNKIQVQVGRMPQSEDECLVDYQLIESGRCRVGDTLTLKSGSEEETEDLIHRDSFTVVGAGTTSLYMSLQRGTTSIGNGSLSGFMVVQPSVFAADYYTQICVTVDGAREMISYSDEYDDYVDLVEEKIEAMEAQRCEIRYAQVQEEGWDKIAEAEADVAEGEEKLADAKEELEDAKQKLADARVELENGKKELADGEKEFREKEQEFLDGKQELADGWEELNEAKADLVLATYKYERGYAQYEEGKAEIDAGYAQLNGLKEAKDGYEQILGAELLYGVPMEAEKAAIRQQLSQAVPDMGQDDNTYLIQLETLISETQKTLDAGAQELEEARQQLVLAEAQIDYGNKEAYEAELELKDAEVELADGEQKLNDARVELADAKKTLADAEAELADAEVELAEGEQEYEEARVENEGKIADAKIKIADAKEELDDLDEAEWYVLDRNYTQIYVEYSANADRIGAIGKVFPMIFFLVAALVSLTTMTRMVEEERTQIGTMKALGYGKWDIASKYMLYALLSSLLGSLIGLVFGQKVFPWVIINAYKMMYVNMPQILLPLHWEYSIMATLAAVCSTTLAAWSACYKELNAVPAKLMRPAAPKAGKRVFLEHMSFLWHRLNFSQKAAVRNLIRYKKRFFMTIFGIGGCMALLLVGFGLQDSITYIGDAQYGEIFRYDGIIGLEKDVKDDQMEELISQMTGDARITNHMYGRETALEVETDGSPQMAYLIIPESTEELGTYFRLADRVTREVYMLDTEGVIINEKLAKLLSVSEGDTIVLKEDDTERVEVTVSHIAENYSMNYIHMDAAVYEKLYGKAPTWNQIYITDTLESEEQENSLKEAYMKLDAVSDVTYISTMADQMTDILTCMDLIILVLIVSAGLLAFVVLYNLNNININERKRELATLKVLGFHDKEVLDYVNRENVMLTVLGALAGVGLGIVLHHFVIVTAEIDTMMFGREIQPMSFVYSILLTFLFSAVINGAMFFKLRVIDMVESLKSVE